MSFTSGVPLDNCRNNADFIVIGAGAGGGILARELLNAGFSVIIIEAGGNHDADPLIADSTNAGELEEEYTWKFFYEQTTEPNENVNGLVMNYTTGRMVGGGTAINGMQYVRGSDSFWNAWSQLNTDDADWKAESVAKSYKKMENFLGASGQYDPLIHGEKGRLLTRQAPVNETTMATQFATALAASTGTSVISDYNNGQTPLGTFTRWSLFQKFNGDRASSSIDFLADIFDENGKPRQPSTHGRIAQNCTASRIIFQSIAKSKPQAYAVEAIQNGQTKIFNARFEVILCAGIHSNQILQRSGVGPSALLTSLGIPVVAANDNVGAHHHNHLISTAIFTAPNGDGVPPSDLSALYVGGGFAPAPSGDPTKRGFQWIGINPEPNIFVAIFYNLNPQSEGTDRIQDRDPLRVSDVNEQIFSDPADLATIVDVYQQQVTALNTQLKTLDAAYDLVEPSLATIADNDLLQEYIKENLEHTHHFQGTNRMLPKTDGGVVNTKGQVYDVERLRVADISVAPLPCDGNTAGPAFLVGYKIAQAIKKCYGRK